MQWRKYHAESWDTMPCRGIPCAVAYHAYLVNVASNDTERVVPETAEANGRIGAVSPPDPVLHAPHTPNCEGDLPVTLSSRQNVLYSHLVMEFACACVRVAHVCA